MGKKLEVLKVPVIIMASIILPTLLQPNDGKKRALFTFLVSCAGGRRCPQQAVITAGHCRYKLCGASKACIRQAYCSSQATVLPLFDHVSHNFTPSQLYLVNTGLKSVGEK